MSMLGRTGTIVRKNRRRSSGNSARGLRRDSVTTPSPSPSALNLTFGGLGLERRGSLTPGLERRGSLSPFSSGLARKGSLSPRLEYGRSLTPSLCVPSPVHRHSLTPSLEYKGGFSPSGERRSSLSPSVHSRGSFLSAEGSVLGLELPAYPGGLSVEGAGEGAGESRRSSRASNGPWSPPSKSVSFSLNIMAPHSLGHPTPSPFDPTCQTQASEKVFYDSTVVWAEVEEADQPSLLTAVCEAGLEANNPCDFLYRAFVLIAGTWPVTVFLVALIALPLVMTTIGVNYLHDCPKEPKLPIYLVVGGIFGIIKIFFLLWKQMRRHREDVSDLHDDEDLITMTRMTNMALNIFLSIWFVFGHYWVFKIWKPHFHPPLHEPRNWCDRTVFLFTFWQLIACHVILGCVLAMGLLFVCCYACVKCLMEDQKT